MNATWQRGEECLRCRNQTNMKTITVVRAGAIGGEQPEEAMITITGEPDDTVSLKAAEAFYEEQAEQLATVLEQTLPGGTLDRVIGRLMARRASLFRVPLYRE